MTYASTTRTLPEISSRDVSLAPSHGQVTSVLWSRLWLRRTTNMRALNKYWHWYCVILCLQLNEVTPFFDGNLMYGPNKAWTDAIRLFRDGLLAATNDSTDPSDLDRDRYFPAINDIRLPFANPSPPRDHVLKPIRRFYSKTCSRIVYRVVQRVSHYHLIKTSCQLLLVKLDFFS